VINITTRTTIVSNVQFMEDNIRIYNCWNRKGLSRRWKLENVCAETSYLSMSTAHTDCSFTPYQHSYTLTYLLNYLLIPCQLNVVCDIFYHCCYICKVNDCCTEWHTGTGTRSRMVLKDEDLTRRSEVGFKRINTLGHYRVSEGAVMALIPRQSSTSDLTIVADRSSFQNRYGELAATDAAFTAFTAAAAAAAV